MNLKHLNYIVTFMYGFAGGMLFTFILWLLVVLARG